MTSFKRLERRRKCQPIQPSRAAHFNAEDEKLGQTVVRTAQGNWPRMVAYSKTRLDGAIDPAMLLQVDGGVDAAILANSKEQIRDFEPYLSFVRRAKWLFRRSQRVEYHDPADLAGLKAASDTDFVADLERHIQLEEAVNLMDEQTRTIYTMSVQGLSRKDIGAALGMSEDAVRTHYTRGIDRVRRLIQEGPKNEPNR